MFTAHHYAKGRTYNYHQYNYYCAFGQPTSMAHSGMFALTVQQAAIYNINMGWLIWDW